MILYQIAIVLRFLSLNKFTVVYSFKNNPLQRASPKFAEAEDATV